MTNPTSVQAISSYELCQKSSNNVFFLSQLLNESTRLAVGHTYYSAVFRRFCGPPYAPSRLGYDGRRRDSMKGEENAHELMPHVAGGGVGNRGQECHNQPLDVALLANKMPVV